MPRCLGQLARQRLGGDHRVGLLFLAIIEAPALRIVLAGEVRGFDIGPGQVTVAVLAVVLALLLAVALAQAFHAAAVAGEMAGVGKASGVAGFQPDGQAEDFPDAGHFLHALEALPFFGDGEDVFFDLGDGFLEAAHEGDLFAAQELVGRRGEEFLRFFDAHAFDAGERQALAQRAFVEAFEAEDQAGAQLDQEQAAAQEIAHGAAVLVIAMAGGQDAQAHEFAQEEGVGDVVGVLETVVLAHLGGVGQHDGIAVICEAIDEPIPVVGRFDGHLGDPGFIRFEQLQDGGQLAGEFLVRDALAAFVHKAAEGVVAVQVDSRHDFHRGSPVG